MNIRIKQPLVFTRSSRVFLLSSGEMTRTTHRYLKHRVIRYILLNSCLVTALMENGNLVLHVYYFHRHRCGC